MDTICAIATAYGKSAISIIRVSGTDAIGIVNKIFKGKNLLKAQTHTIHYGHIVDCNEVIDEVLVTIMRAPKTFTMEDTVEINCHGGMYVTNRVLKLLLNNGAMLASRGEFTKRAFLNGRIDLVEAESIMDMIDSESKKALDLANVGLSGRLSKEIKDIRESILEVLATIEVNIDYPEYEDAIDMTRKELKPLLIRIIARLEVLLKNASKGKMIKEGIKTAIVGRPNVGKSSLLNMILSEQRAIVTDVAGTTRDVIEGDIILAGMVIRLIDTAGIRDTNDIVETIGVNKAKKVMDTADLIILVLDGSQKMTSNDIQLLELTKDKPRIIVLNKMDLQQELMLEEPVVRISTLDEMGLSDLEDKIIDVLGLEGNEKDSSLLSNTRHIVKIEQARNAMESALISIANETPVDIISIDINEAWNSLGEIIGETASDLLIDELFSKFCLGK